MDANQLGRRNLTPDQRSILRGRRYNRTKKAAHAGVNQHAEVTDKMSTTTAESLASEHHVSEKTIRRDGDHRQVLGTGMVTGWTKNSNFTRLNTA